jgi:opacity protein-like surface antigen
MSKLLLGIVIAAGLSTQAFAERKYSEWGPVVNLGCGTINSASDDQGPGVSKDGLSLYLGSNRASPDASGGIDLYVAQRGSPAGAWGMARNLGPTVNSPVTDNIPSLSRDGHWLFFNSDRPGGSGGIDMWASFRAHVHDDFGWGVPFNLGSDVNTAGFDGGASYFENEQGGTPLLFYGSGTSQATSDIWVAELRRDGTFGNARPVAEINTAQADQRPSIRFDGLELFFFSNRTDSTPGPTGAPSSDIWVTTRNSVLESWGAPANLGAVINTPFSEINPHLSADGLTLYFASNRPGGCGGNDLYMTTRTKLTGKD